MNHQDQVEFATLKSSFDPQNKISLSAWFALSESIEAVHANNGLYLQVQGIVPDHIYFLADGIAREFADKNDGSELNRAFHRGPSVIGALSSFKNHRGNASSISMMTEGKLYRISCQAFLNILEKHHDLDHWYLLAMSRNSLQLQNRLQDLLQKNQDERLHIFVSENPDLAAQIPTKHIASYLDVPAVVVNIVKRKFINETRPSLHLTA
ncbi:MAG: Crp/Fnr family transcriptional regulator [Cellvibrionaceae bacterium]